VSDQVFHPYKTPGKKTVTYKPLVNPKQIYLPNLHIKLGLMKHFIKAMGQQSTGF
jgi:hypothetical protein